VPAAAADSKRLVEATTVGMAIFVGQIVTVCFLTYFLLAAGDLFRRRILEVQGPSLSVRKRTLQILNEVHLVSRRYFALMIAANIAVGTATTSGLDLLGMRHPVFWGIAMGVMHSIPYVGTVALAGALGLVAFLQFKASASRSRPWRCPSPRPR
jgi:predicted PurR-regulated permease PerM